jgi:hypothetical protein
VKAAQETLMKQGTGSEDALVLSYLGLRKAVGVIGTSLPFVLAIGNMLLLGRVGIRPSMSAYYYTRMGNVFVGSLCAIAVFLMSYRGYERRDHAAGVLGCIFGTGVALFPTSPEGGPISVVGVAHVVFAASFFLTLAYFSLALFTKTDSPGHETRRKLQRNRVYQVCGYAILTCLALCALGGISASAGLLTVDSVVMKLDPLFWLESAAVVAFGVSWLTKGEAILRDESNETDTGS